MIGEREVLTRAQLMAGGLSRRGLVRALNEGVIVRARRDQYVSAAAPSAVVQAVRIGGRVTCLSLLQLLGVFVFANDVVHVHIPRGASRLRSPESVAKPLGARGGRRRARLHWWPLSVMPPAHSACTDIVDALAHAVRCQPPRQAIATLDSALNKGLIGFADVEALFALLPRKYRVLQSLIDGRAQAGTETLMRLMVRRLGHEAVPQVHFARVGFVDLVVDGWLVVECDSRAFHSDWAQQVKDRARDLELAKLGYVTLRFTAAQILYQPDDVLAALRGMLGDGRRKLPPRN
ncbi:MAG: hypothetical protein K0R60_1155 [Microbacterium sp.]|nr:hypothetical protein [Microbacterium sp.]